MSALLLVASVATNALLTVKLRQANATLNLAAGRMYPQVGWPVRPIAGVELDESFGYDNITYSFEGQVTLALITTPNCKPCMDNYPNWVRVVHEVKAKSSSAKVLVIYTGRPDPGEPLLQMIRPDRVIVSSPGALLANRLNYLTPLTLLVGTRGNVVTVLPDQVDPSAREELMAALARHPVP